MPTKTKQNYKPGIKDLCQTPAYALDPLIPYLHSSNIKTIWECAAGEGYLVKGLEEHNFVVHGTDIQTGYDFLEDSSDFLSDIDCIVTNPPFSLKYKFLKRCYDLDLPFALLMPVEVLGAAAAQRLFWYHGGGVIFMSKRINFKMPNVGWKGKGSQFPVAWFTYKLGLGEDLGYETSFYNYDWLTSEIRKDYEV